jgi:hypothetical protein
MTKEEEVTYADKTYVKKGNNLYMDSDCIWFLPYFFSGILQRALDV